MAPDTSKSRGGACPNLTPRPAEVVAAIRVVTPDLPDVPVLATRLAQEPRNQGAWLCPSDAAPPQLGIGR